MILLDTCVLSEFAKDRPEPAVVAWMASVPDADLRISALTLGEIRKGADLLDSGARRTQIEQWLDGLRVAFADRVVPVDADVALVWGSISAATRRSGRVRSPVDCLLAATAVCHHLTLATRNVVNFEGTGVALVNPWDARLT